MAPRTDRLTFSRLGRTYAARWDAGEHVSWVEEIIAPFLPLIQQHYAGRATVERLGPFGLGARVAFHVYPRGYEASRHADHWLSLVLCPADLRRGRLAWVDESVDTGRYPPGTIGALNGFNHPEYPVPPQAGLRWLLRMLGRSRQRG